MRRKTVQLDKDLFGHRRKTNKNITCAWMAKHLVQGVQKYNQRFQKTLMTSDTIANLIIEDLWESMDPKFRAFDQKQFEKHIYTSVVELQYNIEKTMNPIDFISFAQQNRMEAQQEPNTVALDFVCGGQVQTREHKRHKSKIPSVLESDRKPFSKDSGSKKELITGSSKCLIRLSKEQHLNRKRSLQALKIEPIENHQRHMELLRQKDMKEQMDKLASNLFRTTARNSQKTLNKTARVEQYGYDYDGSAIPIKKFTSKQKQKVNVLNATYKVHSAATSLLKKRSKNIDKASHYAHIKTQMEEPTKENSMTDEAISKIIAARKESVLRSINDLRGINSSREDHDFEFRSKLSEFARSKAIKIRQLKQ